MSVLVYTANIGGRDRPRPQAAQEGADVQWLYATDDPGVVVPAPWYPVCVRPHPELHPNMAAKWHKTHPPTGWDAVVWIDSSMEVTSPRFVAEAVASLEGKALATWRHPRRDSVYDEAEASLGAESQGGRYASLPIRAQMAAYRAEGYPDAHGLYACGTVVWTAAAATLGQAWWDECVRWGYQDQLSFPVVCWRAGVVPAVFPFAQIERRGSARSRAPGSAGWSAGAQFARGGAHREPWLENRWLRIHPHQLDTD